MTERNVVKFEVGKYVLLQYPNRPPDKLSALYRDPMEIVAINCPDIDVRDLTTNKVSSVHTNRLQIFRHLIEMSKVEIEVLDLDEYYVEKIVTHEEKRKNQELDVQGPDGWDMSQKRTIGCAGRFI